MRTDLMRLRVYYCTNFTYCLFTRLPNYNSMQLLLQVVVYRSCAVMVGQDHSCFAHCERGVDHRVAGRGHCPGRKPPFLAVKHPARPYKRTIENRFT